MSEVALRETLPLPQHRFNYQVEQAVLRGERPRVSIDQAPKRWIELMEMCWLESPRQRPSMLEVVSELRLLGKEEGYPYR